MLADAAPFAPVADTDTIRAGLRGTVATLPEGFKLSTILVGGQGVTATVREWGRLALLRYGKSPAAEVIQANYDADPSLRYLSYWTDAGAVSACRCVSTLSSFDQIAISLYVRFLRCGSGLLL